MKISFQGLQNFLGKRKKSDYLILLLIGCLFLILVLPTSKSQTESAGTGWKKSDTNLESRLEDTLSQMEGVGEIRVMITGEKEVEGVLIVAKGASSPAVCQKISEAVLALFDIEPHKIKIVKMV